MVIWFIKVKKEKAQEKIEDLKKANLISKEYKIFSRDGDVYIPLLKFVEGAIELNEEMLEKERREKRNLKEMLKDVLDENTLKKVFTSFDIVGDIAILEIKDDLKNYENLIAETIKKIHKNVRVVAKKASPVEGEYRVRKIQIISGENRTLTLHKENGVSMFVDLEKVYFSPRLSFERKRISNLVKECENILVLFAGVGPFALVVAKNKKCNIVAIEINRDAYELMVKNIQINKLKGTITPILGDAGKVTEEKYSNWADRIIMPLPKGGEKFLKSAKVGAKHGAIIHFYTFVENNNLLENLKKKIEAEIEKDSYEIIFWRVVRPYSKTVVQVVADIRIYKN